METIDMDTGKSIAGESKTGAWAFGCSGAVSKKDARVLTRINVIFLLWAFSYAGFTLGREWLRETIGAGVWLVAAIPMILLAYGCLAYAKFLSTADELTRKIQTDAMSVSFAAAVFLLFGYDILERLSDIRMDLGEVTLMIFFVYTVSILIGQRRYR